jgi:predicted XRE-type DNA-binding protein
MIFAMSNHRSFCRTKLGLLEDAKDRDLTQTEAGKILGIPQPHVSALMRNRSGNFSVGPD